MTLARVMHWHSRAVAYFNGKSGAAPKSAVQQQHTEHITQYVHALTGRR